MATLKTGKVTQTFGRADGFAELYNKIEVYELHKCESDNANELKGLTTKKLAITKSSVARHFARHFVQSFGLLTNQDRLISNWKMFATVYSD